MSWKRVFWYSLTIILFSFLTYYIVDSTIYIIHQYGPHLTDWRAILGLILNFIILLVELFSSFYSIFIYYYIGSSSDYKILKVKTLCRKHQRTCGIGR